MSSLNRNFLVAARSLETTHSLKISISSRYLLTYARPVQGPVEQLQLGQVGEAPHTTGQRPMASEIIDHSARYGAGRYADMPRSTDAEALLSFGEVKYRATDCPQRHDPILS